VPDIHVPKLDEHGGGKSIFKLVLEVALISVGVFLGLAGEQWRERAHQRELAEQALRRFKTEITTNRTAVTAVKDYHADLFKQLTAAIKMSPAERDKLHIRFNGVRPAMFTHAAWDLALATQSLSYITPDLAFSISELYSVQDQMAGLTSGITQAMYAAPPSLNKNEEAFFGAIVLYYGDMTIFEPRLIELYDAVLPKIDNALEEHPLKTESH
jgi:hypothetical protein